MLPVVKVNNKYTKRCHAVFTFNFEHIQQINQIYLLLTLNMYLSVGHRIKSQEEVELDETFMRAGVRGPDNPNTHLFIKNVTVKRLRGYIIL